MATSRNVPNWRHGAKVCVANTRRWAMVQTSRQTCHASCRCPNASQLVTLSRASFTMATSSPLPQIATGACLTAGWRGEKIRLQSLWGAAGLGCMRIMSTRPVRVLDTACVVRILGKGALACYRIDRVHQVREVRKRSQRGRADLPAKHITCISFCVDCTHSSAGCL